MIFLIRVAMSAKPCDWEHSTHSYLLVNTKKRREKQINKLLIN